MMRDDAWKAYESWRRLWLSGGDSNAIAALRFHGLHGALAMAGAACNRMANAAGAKGSRGDTAPSQQGRAGLRLQNALPDARILYVSATGATTTVRENQEKRHA